MTRTHIVASNRIPLGYFNLKAFGIGFAIPHGQTVRLTEKRDASSARHFAFLWELC